MSEPADDFARIVRDCSPRLFRLAARLLGDLAEAEDVLQDCFVRLHTRLERGAGADGPVEGWLRKVVVNAALDALRSRRRRAAREDAAWSDELVDPGASLEARAALRDLSGWLSELAPEQRAALVLKELEGHTSAEVARLMGCSEGAVEQRLVRARARLRGRRDRHG